MNHPYVKAILFGVITIFISILLASFSFTFLIKYTAITESTFHYLTLASAYISFFIGGIVTGLKGKGNGWLIGLITGIIFVFSIFIFQFTAYDSSFSLEQFIFHCTYVLATISGSIIGVNLTSKNQT